MKKFLSIVSIVAAMALSVVACEPEEDPVVAVSSVSLNQASVSLEVGGTVSLSASVSPSDATDKTVTWSSSNTGVATVSDGVVKAVGEGSAVITASAGGKSASCQVTVSPVRIAVTGISLDQTEITLYAGDTLRLVASVSPADASDKSVAWISSNSSVATVDPDGLVTATGPGTCSISALSGNFGANCTVNCIKVSGFPEGELPPDDEIWYTTSDDKALDKVLDQGPCVLLSNTYHAGKGMGILKFSGPLKTIGRLAGSWDENLRVTGILIPDCMERFGFEFLRELGHVKEVRIPSSFKEMEQSALTSYKGTELERFTGHHVSEDGRLVILDGVVYGFAPAGLSSYEIPSTVKALMSGSFANTDALKSVVLPSSLTNLDEFTFNASGLESVTIPSSIKTIDSYAFLGCDHLTTLLGDSPFISEDRKFLYQADNPFYPMMLFFFAGKNDTSYEIPEGIQTLQFYAFAGCDKLRSVTFPNSLVQLRGSNVFERCDNLETLLGAHTTSDHKGFITEWNELQYLVPSISDDYVVPDEVTAIGRELFENRRTLRSVTMGDQVTSIGHYAFSFCPNLKSVTLSANLTTLGYNPFWYSTALEAIYFRSIVPPVYSDDQFTESPALKCYVPAQALRLYQADSGWKDYWNTMVPYQYDDLPEPDFYLSSDYSKEGEVTVYQKATEGNGIDVVFMGDAYSDRQLASGLYRKDMEACAEAFFAVEPFKSFRKLFNIYFVTTVSSTEGYERGGRSLGTSLGIGTVIGGNDARCFELALKAVGDEKRMDEVLVIVCGNQKLDGVVRVAGTCYMNDPTDWTGRDYASGPSVAYFLKMDESLERTGDVIRHEAGGHGFAKLADEYYYPGTISSRDEEVLRTRAPYRWYSNVDITSDPAKVKWSAFLGDERYQHDGIGVFEGGFTYEFGVWRATQTSIMDNNAGGFNAPSRHTIWYRIHKLAYGSSWNGSYEDFVAYDVINRKTATAAYAPLRSYATAWAPRQTAAPVVTGRTWRNAGGISK